MRKPLMTTLTALVLMAVAAGVAVARTVQGTPGPDRIVARADGPHEIHGAGGGDTLIGGPAGDRILGEGGGDHLFGRAGDDQLDGSSGDDTLSG